MPTNAALWADAHCALGEGPLWCERRQALFWTDIEGAALWMCAPATGTTITWRLPDRAGCFALAASGRVLLGLAKGLAYADLDRRGADGVPAVEPIVPVEPDEPRTRVNDGRTDRAGRFVFGTMNEAHAASGARIGHLYQYSAAHGLRALNVEPVAITNSICFSPDGGTMYFADSLDRRILQADYDSDRARVSHVRTFATLGVDRAVPDGSVVDAEGGLWNAVWGGGCVQRYDANGRVVDQIDVAARHTTCPAFGGPALRDLYITSSRLELDAETLARLPASGGVFRATPGVTGLADRRFADR